MQGVLGDPEPPCGMIRVASMFLFAMFTMDPVMFKRDGAGLLVIAGWRRLY
jgi:hypothetical protein